MRIRTLGAEDEDTLTTEGHLASALLNLGEYAEAEAVGRCTLEKRRRILGRDHQQTLVTAGNLASSLSGQGKHAEAADIEREVFVLRTRLLGAEHENTLISAFNFAVSLWRCGQIRRVNSSSATHWLCLGALSVRLTRSRSVCFTSFVRSVSQRDERS